MSFYWSQFIFPDWSQEQTPSQLLLIKEQHPIFVCNFVPQVGSCADWRILSSPYGVKIVHNPCSFEILSSLSQTVRVLEENRWHTWEIKESLIKGLYWKIWTGSREINKEYSNNPWGWQQLGKHPTTCALREGREGNSTEEPPDRTCGLYVGEGSILLPCQGGSQWVATHPHSPDLQSPTGPSIGQVRDRERSMQASMLGVSF